MNKRIKKKKQTTINDRIKQFEKEYIISLFDKLLNCSNYDRQRWFYHAARKAAHIYSKKIMKSINKSPRHLIDGYSVQSILTAFTNRMADQGMTLRQKENFIRYILNHHSKKKHNAINDVRRFDEHLEDCRNLFGVNVTNESPYQIMMDHSKQRAEFRKKHPELEYMFKAWDREREYLNSHPASSNTNLKILYAEDEDEIEDAVIISESFAKKICESSDDVIRGHRLPDGWENEEIDNARKISDFDETLDGTFDGLINYHEAVAGCGGNKEYDKR